jgi:hypothetical protein
MEIWSAVIMMIVNTNGSISIVWDSQNNHKANGIAKIVKQYLESKSTKTKTKRMKSDKSGKSRKIDPSQPIYLIK